MRLLFAAAMALSVHALLLVWEVPPRRWINRPLQQAVSIRLVNPPSKLDAHPVPEPPRPVPAKPRATPESSPRKSVVKSPPLPAPAADHAIEQLPQDPPSGDPPEPDLPPASDEAPPGLSRKPATETETVRTSVPRYDLNPPIAYPAPARRRQLEGTVLLDVFVTADGHPAQVKVARSSGHAILDSSAVQAVSRWRFDPARRGERPIAMWVQVPVRYALE